MGVAAGEGRGGGGGCSACQKSIAMLFPVSECECVGGVNTCTFYSSVLLAQIQLKRKELIDPPRAIHLIMSIYELPNQKHKTEGRCK